MKPSVKFAVAFIAVAGIAIGVVLYTSFASAHDEIVLPSTVQSQEVRLGSKFGGRVAEVFVREGQHVPANTPLLRLDIPETEAQRDQVKAKLISAEAELRKAEYGARPTELREAEAQTKVYEAKYRRLKAGPRAEEIREAQQELRAAEADASGTLDTFQRAKKAGPAVSDAEYRGAIAAHDRATARVHAATARLDLLRAGTHPDDLAEAAAERDRWKAREDLLREGVRSEDIARAAASVQELQAHLRELEAQVRESVIRAIEPGVVEVVGVRPGDLLQPNQPAIRMLRSDDVWVRAFVPETELGRVKVNQTVAVTIDSHPGQRFVGTVIHIAGESEFTPRNVQTIDERRHQVFAVKVRVDDADGVFKAGMAADVLLPINGENR